MKINGSIRIKKYTDDDKLSIFISLFMGFNIILVTFNLIVNTYIQYGAKWDSAICVLLLLGALCMALGSIFKGLHGIDYLYLFLVAFALCFSLLYQGNEKYLASNWMKFIFTVFPLIYVGIVIRNYNNLEKYLIRYSKWTILITCAFCLIYYSKGSTWAENMDIAYYALPCTLFAIYYTIKNHLEKYIVWAALGIVNTIIFGTRGPILLFVIFIILCIIRFYGNGYKKFLMIGLLIIACLIIYVNYVDVLQFVYDFLNKNFHINNIAIYKVLHNSTSDFSNGRNQLINESIQNFNLFGYGLYGDRVLLGTYPHNLFCELCLQYGIIIGLLFFIIFLITIIKYVIDIWKSDVKWMFAMICIMCGVVKLFISGSYLEEPWFFLLIGIMIGEARQKKVLLHHCLER